MNNNEKSLYILLKKYCDFQQIRAGKDLFSFGKPANRVYLILKGQVSLFIKDENEEEREITRLVSGDILGEAALLEKAKYSSRATAYTDTNLLVFSPENFKRFIFKQTAITEKVLKNLCKRIQTLQKPEVKIPEIMDQSKKGTNEENKDDANIKEETEITIKKKDISNFYLKGHGKYSKIADEGFEPYLYTKKVKCPVCSSRIEIKKIRNSRLRLQEIRNDLRPIYKNFKPYWYEIWTCQQCFYTAPKKYFFDLNKKKRKKIKAQFKEKIQSIFGPGYKPGFSKPRKLNEVFNAYYLAIQLYKLIDASNYKFAYLWLRLSWLYEDIDEKELSEEASYRSMEYLRDFYFNNNSTNLSPNQNDKITLLLSILFYKHGLIEEAIPLLNKLIQRPQTKVDLKNRSRDLMIKIRELQRNANN